MKDVVDIKSDIASYREISALAAKEVGFYFVSSNRELLLHMEKLMNQAGVCGVMDASGRVHYVVDARKGAPLAGKRAQQTISKVVARESKSLEFALAEHRRAIDHVVSCYNFNKHLRGYRLLKVMLEMALVDESLLNPVSKRLYPAAGELLGVTGAQAERNIRYLFEDLRTRENKAQTAGNRSEILSYEGKPLPVAKTLLYLLNQCRKFSAQNKTTPPS